MKILNLFKKADSIKPNIAPRDYALELIKKSNNIFIGYSHSDIKTTTEIRKKLIKLRNEKNPSKIFLDQDSLLPSGDVSPEDIDTRLRNADLHIFVCGKDTSKRVEVQREISISLDMRKRGQCQILPIIIQSGLKLPHGLDYSVQGIFLKTLFPEFKYRILIFWLLLLLVISASVSLVLKERENIDAQLALDDASEKTPLNLFRKNGLEEIHKNARNILYFDAANEALVRSNKIPKEKFRKILVPKSNNLDIEFCGNSQTLAVASAKEIVFFNVDNGLEQKKISLERSKWNWMSRSGINNSLIYEVTYPHFADHSKASNVVASDSGKYAYLSREGEEIRGQEREIYSVDCNNLESKLLGKSAKLDWKIGRDSGGDEHGPSWYDLDDVNTEISKDIALQIENFEPFIRESLKLPEKSELSRLALSSDEKSQLYQIKEFLIQEDEDHAARFGDFWSIYTIVVTDDKKTFKIDEPIFYSPGAKDFAPLDGERPTDVLPVYKPSALSLSPEIAVLNDRILNWKNKKILSNITGLNLNDEMFFSISNDGNTIVSIGKGHEVSLISVKTGKFLTRFYPGNAKKTLITPDASKAILLNNDGSIHSWSFEAFGTDGWAKPN